MIMRDYISKIGNNCTVECIGRFSRGLRNVNGQAMIELAIETGIYMLMKGSQRKFLKDVRAIGGELQHKLLKVVSHGRWIRKIKQSHAVKISCPKVWKLWNDEVKEKFFEKIEVLY